MPDHELSLQLAFFYNERTPAAAKEAIYVPALETIANYARSVWPRVKTWSNLRIFYIMCEYQKLLAFLYLGRGMPYRRTIYGKDVSVALPISLKVLTTTRRKLGPLHNLKTTATDMDEYPPFNV